MAVRCNALVSGRMQCWFTKSECEGTVPGRYRKLLAVLKHIESELVHGCSVSFVEAAERFAMHSEGAWLKVAGGEKAEVLQGLARQLPSSGGCNVVEFGTFIGYTAIRVGGLMREQCQLTKKQWATGVLTVEADPVHVLLSRHFLDLVKQSAFVEVLPGVVRDAMPAIGEAFGTSAAALVFMDQSGSTFHMDSLRLEQLSLLQANAEVVADNVLRPGAPVYVWAVATKPLTTKAMYWSLPEFLEESAGVEDWMSVACHLPETA